jgi:hypothetical protein
MSKVGEMTLKGESGNDYEFTVYTRDTDFKALGAVYVQSKRTIKSGGGGSHDLIYVGQTGDLSGRPLNHHKKDCFDKHGSNCVSILLEENEKRRLAIETDLINGNKWPCNG